MLAGVGDEFRLEWFEQRCMNSQSLSIKCGSRTRGASHSGTGDLICSPPPHASASTSCWANPAVNHCARKTKIWCAQLFIAQGKDVEEWGPREMKPVLVGKQGSEMVGWLIRTPISGTRSLPVTCGLDIPPEVQFLSSVRNTVQSASLVWICGAENFLVRKR